MPQIRAILIVAALSLAVALPARAAFETAAKAAWVFDVGTQTVLLEKDADRALPPASMSKLMTIYMLFEALKDGRVSMDTTFPVSARAQAMGGSTMFLNTMDRPTVEELIRGIIVNSGNDACVVVAEGLAGSEEAFSRLATDRARALGMTQTNLVNSSGWPHPEHRMSMRDLGILTYRIITDFPDLYAYFDEREFDYKNRSPANRFNRNPLFRMNIGADGLKTGHTREAGYGFAGSAVQGDRRVIFVVTGLDSERDRAEESARIVNWAFRQFSQVSLAAAGQRVAEADVWLGAAPAVGLVPARDATVLVPAGGREGVAIRVAYRGPVEAPVAAGQYVGDLVISVPDLPETRIPLLAESDVPRGGPLVRLTTAARVLAGRAVGLLAF
ncbi:MAG: D-alanyl-D-alanine carboxypeptidase family protein [Gemmobacter sp.]